MSLCFHLTLCDAGYITQEFRSAAAILLQTLFILRPYFVYASVLSSVSSQEGVINISLICMELSIHQQVQNGL